MKIFQTVASNSKILIRERMNKNLNSTGAFYNDPKIKEKYVKRVKEHQKLDEIIQGDYWENGKGCAVGCTIHGDSHQAYEDELNISISIARLEDGIFEGLPAKEARLFPLRFIEAISEGADLSLVIYKFNHWLLIDEKYGVINHAKTEGTKNSIIAVSELFNDKINGTEINKEQWLAASASFAASASDYAAAYDHASASDYAAAAAACAAAAASIAADYAAASAAYDYVSASNCSAASAGYDYVSASDSASDSAYAYDYDYDYNYAKEEAYIKQAEKLIEILKNS